MVFLSFLWHPMYKVRLEGYWGRYLYPRKVPPINYFSSLPTIKETFCQKIMDEVGFVEVLLVTRSIFKNSFMNSINTPHNSYIPRKPAWSKIFNPVLHLLTFLGGYFGTSVFPIQIWFWKFFQRNIEHFSWIPISVFYGNNDLLYYSVFILISFFIRKI